MRVQSRQVSCGSSTLPAGLWCGGVDGQPATWHLPTFVTTDSDIDMQEPHNLDILLHISTTLTPWISCSPCLRRRRQELTLKIGRRPSQCTEPGEMSKRSRSEDAQLMGELPGVGNREWLGAAMAAW